LGKRPRLGFADSAALEGGSSMTDDASVASERLSDTLIAAAVLILLIVGWVQGLGGAELERLWALRTYLVSNAHASGPVR
jgi:hypothetical protein